MNFTPFQFTQTPGVLPPGSVTNAELADMAARTVKVNATNASASPQDLQGTTPLNVLQVNAAGTGLEWGAATATSLTVTAAPRLVGRTTAGSGTSEQISVDATLTLAALSLGRAALTGDVTASAGSNATTIANNAVTDAKFRQSAGLSVVGRSANSTGNVADITAANDGEVLRLSGTTLGFGTLAAGAFANNTVALTRLANAGAQYDIVGRKTASGGAWEDCTRTQLNLAGTDLPNTFLGTQTLDENGSVLNMVLYSDDPGALGPVLRFNHDSASPATNDTVFTFQMFGRDSAATAVNYGSITAQIVTPTAGATASKLNFATISPAGASTNRFHVQLGAYTSGATGADKGADSINTSTYYANGNLAIDTNALLRNRAFTVGTLPAAAAVTGGQAYVTDALAAPVYNAVAAAGGTTFAKVVSDGTNWRYA